MVVCVYIISIVHALNVHRAIKYLAMLLQLRNAYNGDWVPDWNDPEQPKHAILMLEDEAVCDVVFHVRHPLVFKSPELQKKFILYPEIREYIMKAAPLL